MIDPDLIFRAVVQGHDTMYLIRAKVVLEDDDELLPGEDGIISNFVSFKGPENITLAYLDTYADKTGFQIISMVPVCSLERFVGAAMGPETWDEMQAIMAEEDE